MIYFGSRKEEPAGSWNSLGKELCTREGINRWQRGDDHVGVICKIAGGCEIWLDPPA